MGSLPDGTAYETISLERDGADLGAGDTTFERAVEPFAMDRHADGGGVLARRIFDTEPVRP